MSKPALFIKTKCQPGKRDEVRRLWEQHLKPRVQDGDTQDAYFYCYDVQDSDTFYIFELYASQEAAARRPTRSWDEQRRMGKGGKSVLNGGHGHQ
jgi:quinol monooxygenase YgiN